MAELLRTRKGRTSKKKERERKSQESHSRFSKSMLTPTCRVLDVEVSISDEVTPLITHTNINHLAFFFSFCNPEELCWGLCPTPLIQILNGIIRNGTVQVAKSK